MKLLDLQKKLSLCAASLIVYASLKGYAVTLGEVWRPPETAALYAKQGKGIVNSLHCKRLAIDINLFKGEKYLTDPEEYKFLADYWGTLTTDDCECSAGYYFRKKDAGHFSIAYNGVR